MFLLVKPLPYISLHKFLYWNSSYPTVLHNLFLCNWFFFFLFCIFHSETGRSKVLSCLWVIIWWIWVRSKWSKYPLSSILEIWVILGFSLFFTLHLARSSLVDYLFNLLYLYPSFQMLLCMLILTWINKTALWSVFTPLSHLVSITSPL